ncbi:MAG: hypothetical protein Q8Q09_23400 [Deltaproteobacteria bacterium]|nr:hypothetical protein [Deltaproteobacteria bacterium]
MAILARGFGAHSAVAIGGEGESDGVVVRPLRPGAIEAFRSRLDCIVVSDASQVPLGRVLDEARRALGRDGIVVVASDALAEGTFGTAQIGPTPSVLRRLLEARFAQTELFGCGPFLGFTFASLDQEGEGVSLETRLLSDEPAQAERYIAVASDADLALDAMAIVQLAPDASARLATQPAPEVHVALDEGPQDEDLRDRASAREALFSLRERVQELEQALATASKTRADESTRAAREQATLDNLRRELEQERARAVSSETRAAQAKRDADSLRETLERQSSEQKLVGQRVRDLQAELSANSSAVALDMKRLEGSLIARGHEVTKLREELTQREHIAQELLFQLETAKTTDQDEVLNQIALRGAEVAKLHAAVRAEAEQLARQNDILREQVVSLEARAERKDAEVKQLTFHAQQRRSAEESANQATASLRLAELDQRVVAQEATIASLRSELLQVAANERSEAEASVAVTMSEHAARAARARDEADEEAARVRALAESERKRATQLDAALRETLERLRAVESSESDARARAASADARLAAVSSGNSRDLVAETHASTQALLQAAQEQVVALKAGWQRELSSTQSELVSLQEALDERDRALRTIRAELNQLRASTAALEADRARLAEETSRATDDLTQTKHDLGRLLALEASSRDQAMQLGLELEGMRKGYIRRTRELEHEVEQLVRALEIATSDAGEESDAVASVLRDLDAARAGMNGMRMRLDDLEVALTQVSHDSKRPSTLDVLGDVEPVIDNRAEQLLATLAETATRLATTEEELIAGQQEIEALRARVAEASTSPTVPTAEGTSTQDTEDRELLVRSLVAQLEDRDLRLRALERRLVEEVERARRTESEIWELELRARDQRIGALQRELARSPSSPSSPPAEAHDPASPPPEAELARLRTQIERAQASIDVVRKGLSSLLVDGRGAGVAHELVALLRQVDTPAV